MHQEHLAELRAALAGVRRRWVATRALRAVARLLAGVCGAVALLLAAELWFAPPGLPMLLVAATALLATTLFAVRVLWPLRERPSDRRVARLVEERCPELEDRVASATELGETGAAAAFHQLVVADAAKRLRGVDPGLVVVPPAQLRAAIGRSVLATVALLVLLAFGGEPIGRVARTAWLYAFGSDLTLTVEPGDVLVAMNAGEQWMPIFPVLGALVLDEGSVLQHAAIVAREFGVPMVIQTKDATARIRDGQTVTVDGAQGIVELGI